MSNFTFAGERQGEAGPERYTYYEVDKLTDDVMEKLEELLDNKPKGMDFQQ